MLFPLGLCNVLAWIFFVFTHHIQNFFYLYRELPYFNHLADCVGDCDHTVFLCAYYADLETAGRHHSFRDRRRGGHDAP